MYFIGWSQGLESWSHGLSYWCGFLKWNPGEKVWSGTGNATKYFFKNTKKLSDMGVNFLA